MIALMLEYREWDGSSGSGTHGGSIKWSKKSYLDHDKEFGLLSWEQWNLLKCLNREGL